MHQSPVADTDQPLAWMLMPPIGKSCHTFIRQENVLQQALLIPAQLRGPSCQQLS